MPLDVYICCLCCSLSTMHPVKGKVHDSNSTRGQRTKVGNVYMHRAIQAHNTPHTTVQQSTGGTHTANTGKGIQGGDLLGLLESHRRGTLKLCVSDMSTAILSLPVFQHPSTRTALSPPAPPSYHDHTSTHTHITTTSPQCQHSQHSRDPPGQPFASDLIPRPTHP